MVTRLQYTEFRHENPLYTSLYEGSIAIHICNIAFDDSSDKIKFKDGVMILYTISKRLVPEDKSDIKTILDAIKVKGDKWVLPQIKVYKLAIPENHTFISLKPFYLALGITPTFKLSLFKGEYQTNLKPPPKKFT